MDRHTVASSGDFTESPDDQYLENNCVDDPVKLCDFQLLENRIMKTVDSVYQVGTKPVPDLASPSSERAKAKADALIPLSSFLPFFLPFMDLMVPND